VGADGNLEWTARKGTWGEGFNAVGSSGGEPFLGQWYDAESGLHYNLFRYYDTEVGRYISPDPVDLLGGLNCYRAVSDPFTKYDRLGLNDGCGPTGPTKPKPATPPAVEESVVDPATLRWSQTTAGGRGRAAEIRASMAARGWDGPPIDVVSTPEGLVTVDHTRAAVAVEQGITQVPVRIHAPDEALPPDMVGRPWNQAGDTASTWGGVVAVRGAGQSPPIGPTGTSTPPRLPRT
jgi:RHS repeat-associated protein